MLIDGGSSVTVDSAIEPVEHLQIGGTLDLARGAAAISVNGDYQQTNDGIAIN